MAEEYRKAFENAEVLAPASRTYNCHSYAWNLSAGGTQYVWMNQFKTNGQQNIQQYWSDGSYIKTTEANAEKIFYHEGDHSAIVAPSSYPGKYDSKWGSAPLMRHNPTDVPSIYDATYREYYASSISQTNITGPTIICTSGESFSIANLPSNTTASWSSSSNISFPSGNTGSSVSAKVSSSTTSGSGWIEATLTNSNGSFTLPRKTFFIEHSPTISFDDTSLRDAIIAGISPDNYPDLPITSGNRIPVDIQHTEEIIWRNTREKIYIPEDKPGVCTIYDPASLIRYVPYFACSPIENFIGKRFTAPESEGTIGSVDHLTNSIDYYFMEDFYRNPPTPEERPELPDGLSYPMPDYEMLSPYVLDHLSPKIYFADKGLIEVEVTASNQCGCVTKANVYNTPKQIQTSTSTPQPKESPYSLVMFPNPADTHVTISIVKSNEKSGEIILERDEVLGRGELLKKGPDPRQPQRGVSQNKYTIEVYNALSGSRIEQKYVYDDALPSLLDKIVFTSLNTAGYREGIYLIKVISETENTLITGKIVIKH